MILVIAGLHGDELNAVEAAKRIAKEFKKSRRIKVIVPANRHAYAERMRRSSLDNFDLNRCFPGNKKGKLTKKLAYEIFEEVKRSSLVIDLHTGSRGMALYPHIRIRGKNAEVDEKIKELAGFSGIKHVLIEKVIKGNLQNEAKKLGIPVITIEAGEGGKVEPWAVDLLASAAGKIIKNRSDKKRNKIVLLKRKKVKSPINGKLHAFAKLGEKVRKAQKIAEVNNVYVESPCDGFIVSLATGKEVKKNSVIASVGYGIDSSR